jgi:hypothetical protein
MYLYTKTYPGPKHKTGISFLTWELSDIEVNDILKAWKLHCKEGVFDFNGTLTKKDQMQIRGMISDSKLPDIIQECLEPYGPGRACVSIYNSSLWLKYRQVASHQQYKYKICLFSISF